MIYKVLLLLAVTGAVYAKRQTSVVTHPKPIEIGGRAISQNLYIDIPYDAGDWGIVDLCLDGSFAFAVEIMYAAPGNLDESAINAIKLYCKDIAYHDTGYVTSSTANNGAWYGMQICSGTNYLTGFRGNVLKAQGLFDDDVALEDFEANCNYGSEIVDGVPIPVPFDSALSKNFQAGDWSSWATCNQGLAVCGLQTRLDLGTFDDITAISDVVLFCCSLTP